MTRSRSDLPSPSSSRWPGSNSHRSRSKPRTIKGSSEFDMIRSDGMSKTINVTTTTTRNNAIITLTILIMMGLIGFSYYFNRTGVYGGNLWLRLSHPHFPRQSIRIFGPVPRHDTNGGSRLIEDSIHVHHQWISESDRLQFILIHGEKCWPQLKERYVTLPTWHQLEAWKYCMMFLGYGNVYQDSEAVSWFVDPGFLSETGFDTKHTGPWIKHTTMVIVDNPGVSYHPSFLRFHKKVVPRKMLEYLMEISPSRRSQKDGSNLSLSLHSNEALKFTRLVYQKLYQTLESLPKVELPIICPGPCPKQFCCQVIHHDNQVLAAVHPVSLLHAHLENREKTISNPRTTSIITIRHTGLVPPSRTETPNFFDILVQNDCLPTSKVCAKCLKRPTSSCIECADACGCYCQRALCQIRPPPKVITQIWTVHPPPTAISSSPEGRAMRWIPRKIHQTWFEPVTKSKYPNMSRLIESWKTRGWEYTFYDDAKAATFLEEHFPPAVKEAYDAIIPGAFKADLFRYCVLLIEGGVYADMDLLLESNLDAVLEPDVGFFVPIDEPGSGIGHRSCLWNGWLAVAPGHAVLAQTIEWVVNHIRNRFTSVDYDDFLCPNPVLSVSHTVDTLFTCGPCILGAAMNFVWGRHPQTEWTVGEFPGINATTTTTTATPPGVFGRTIIASQHKTDMGAHRFTWLDRNIIVAATDMPDYDDRPPSKQHYSRTHEKVGVYGLRNLYTNSISANEDMKIVVSTTNMR
jgi:hypothetical protein